jgi:deoxycytidine triphosphate deaminase
LPPSIRLPYIRPGESILNTNLSKLVSRWLRSKNKLKGGAGETTGIAGVSHETHTSGGDTAVSGSTPGQTASEFAEASAEGLYHRFVDRDPFPDVPPALLNSGHVGDYMETVSLVHPYEPNRRKAASYAMRLGNEIAFSDPDTTTPLMKRRILDDGEIFTLKPNSLVFVRTLETFQLPNYIAARFNLHIDLVHKGLLLGTGPLVDPGFRGRLLVPLHNMTTNEYELRAGDEFIWAEFTKTTMVREWLNYSDASHGTEPRSQLIKFGKAKKNRDMGYYLDKARKPLDGSETRSESYNFPANAVPKTIAHAEELAYEARDMAVETERKRRSFQRWNVAVGVAILFGVFSLYYMTLQVVIAGQEILKENATQAGVEDLDGLISSALVYDRSFLSAQVLYMELCAANQARSEGRPILQEPNIDVGDRIAQMVEARRTANAAARKAERTVPFPDPRRLDLTTCPVAG